MAPPQLAQQPDTKVAERSLNYQYTPNTRVPLTKLFHFSFATHIIVTQLNMVNSMFENVEENIKKLQQFRSAATAGVAGASGSNGGGSSSTAGGGSSSAKPMHYIENDIEDLPTILAHKIQEFVSHNQDDGTALPWHKLLSIPAKQMIVIDRMHSGARRFVVLDFGAPIILTDVVSSKFRNTMYSCFLTVFQFLCR